MMHKFWNEEAGLEVSEYALMMAVILVALVAAVLTLQDRISTTFEQAAAAMEGTADTPTLGGASPQEDGRAKGNLLSRIVVWLHRAPEPPETPEPGG